MLEEYELAYNLMEEKELEEDDGQEIPEKDDEELDEDVEDEILGRA